MGFGLAVAVFELSKDAQPSELASSRKQAIKQGLVLFASCHKEVRSMHVLLYLASLT
jgi:hypothetical protein